LLIGGPNEPPAGAADPSSIYRATDERRELLFREVIAVSRTHCRGVTIYSSTVSLYCSILTLRSLLSTVLPPDGRVTLSLLTS
ncbi:hypothetical protein T09_2957, partial [Trichinella sp. T9]